MSTCNSTKILAQMQVTTSLLSKQYQMFHITDWSDNTSLKCMNTQRTTFHCHFVAVLEDSADDLTMIILPQIAIVHVSYQGTSASVNMNRSTYVVTAHIKLTQPTSTSYLNIQWLCKVLLPRLSMLSITKITKISAFLIRITFPIEERIDT